MGFSTEHRGRGPKVFVPGTGQFLNSTCIRTNQSSDGIRYSAVIDSHVPKKKQGKRHKKKHLSKEAFRKIRYKQNMWLVYKHTGKDKDYDAYKEALNAATNEVRKSKRHFEHKLAQHIKSTVRGSMRM